MLLAQKITSLARWGLMLVAQSLKAVAQRSMLVHGVVERIIFQLRGERVWKGGLFGFFGGSAGKR
jgi:hypothetical protein